MRQVTRRPSLIPVPDLRAYFHRALRDAAQTQRIDADQGTLAYLTHLMTDYARSERLFDHTQAGLVRRPLVEIYKQAQEAECNGERELALQRLGDLALFVAGILPHSLTRSLVDVDYYIAMGSSAYGCLRDSGGAGVRVRALRSVFAQLSGRFVEFVDLLAEAVEQGQEDRPPDLMRLHALWAKTGSRRLGRKLVQYGVVPQRTVTIN
ncbi:MAG: hypothetical protein ACM3ST_05585 [Bdellovibrio bacteriovorus]